MGAGKTVSVRTVDLTGLASPPCHCANPTTVRMKFGQWHRPSQTLRRDYEAARPPLKVVGWNWSYAVTATLSDCGLEDSTDLNRGDRICCVMPDDVRPIAARLCLLAYNER